MSRMSAKIIKKRIRLSPLATVIILFLLLFTVIVNLSIWRRAHLTASYWSLLSSDYCSDNGVGIILENLYKLDQRLTYLKLNCPTGVQLSRIDLSPRLSLLNLISRDHLRPDWSRFSLKGWGADIAYSDFTNAKFNESNLERVNALKGYFTGADFSHANLEESFFALTTLDSAKLATVYAHNTSFVSASMTYADLSYGEFTGVDFDNADLRGADFTYADLEGADFRKANLTDANFNSAYVVGANFENADLAGASFDQAEGLTCEQIESAKNQNPELLAKLCAHKLPER